MNLCYFNPLEFVVICYYNSNRTNVILYHQYFYFQFLGFKDTLIHMIKIFRYHLYCIRNIGNNQMPINCQNR